MRAWLRATKSIDFWLFGGLLILVWIPSQFLGPLNRFMPWIESFLTLLGVWRFRIQLIANFPHFMASYYLAYWRHPRFWLQHGWILLALPLSLLALIGWVVSMFMHPEMLQTARSWMSVLLALMFASVGWHYAKQHYGIVVAVSGREKYTLDRKQKDLVRYSLLSVWWVNWSLNNVRGSDFDYVGFLVPAAGLKSWMTLVPTIIMCGLTFIVIAQVAQSNRIRNQAWPPIRAQVAWFSLPLSLLSIVRMRELQTLLIPVVHSYQYLLFVVRRLRSRWNLPHREFRTRICLWFGWMMLIGWAGFWGLPALISRHLDPTLGISSAVEVGASIFFNIHHYFIDHVLWKRTDPEMQAHIVNSMPASIGAQPALAARTFHQKPYAFSR